MSGISFSTRFRRLAGLSLLFGLLVSTSACSQSSQTPPAHSMTAYDRMLSLLYKQTVPTIAPAKLAETLRQSPEEVVLLDTRSSEEYQVSHLRGARFVDFATLQTATFSDIPYNQTVIVYCTVGARSEQVGARLRSLGFQHVQNLYGGIFQWVNEGYPVYNQTGQTPKVHPYSALWRPWLKRGEAAYN